jgi:hypothetical protein
MTEYAIQPLSLRCARSGRELKPGEPYYSVLIESPNGYVRSDYCVEAWSGPPAGAVGFWRSIVSPPGKERRTLVDDSVLLDCFIRMADSDAADKRNFRFILALLLLRRRVLKLAGSTRENGVDMLQLRAAGGEVHNVVNPNLSEEELAAIQLEVQKMLETSVE